MTGQGTVERVTTVSRDRHGVTARVRDHTLATDRPREMGGGDAGLMASEHVLVALASCTSTTAMKVAEKRGVRLDRVEITADMAFDERGEPSGIRLDVVARSPDDEAAVRKLFDLAERACTVSKLLKITPSREIRVLAP